MITKSVRVVLLLLLISLVAAYIFTPFIPNCDCVLDKIKSDKAQVKSWLIHSDEKMWVNQEINVNSDSSKKIYVGVANRINKQLKFSILVLERTDNDELIGVTTGKFEYGANYVLSQGKTVLIPITYHAPNYKSVKQFVVYVINSEVAYGNEDYAYAANGIQISVT